MTLGVVSIKEVLTPVFNSSPELFTDPIWDYSIYVKDVSEENEPFVGHGLTSKLLDMNNSEMDDKIMILGQVCSNFVALLSNEGPSETLEIKLKFVKVKRQDQQQQFQFQQEFQTMPQQSSPQLQQTNTKSQSCCSSVNSIRQGKNQRIKQLETATEYQDQDENEKHDAAIGTFTQPKPISSSAQPKVNRFINNNPAPKAARTQSLPVFENMMKPPSGKPIQKFPTDSIARRIYMADKLNGTKVEEKTIGLENNVSKRFASDFIKDKKSEPKKKIRKNSTTYFTTKSKTSKINTIPEEHQLYQSCFNCKTMEAKGWKWNESEDLSRRGLLCSLCYTYLKEKGIMRPRKLYKNTARIYKDKTPKITSSSPSSANDLTPSSNNNKNLSSSSSAYDNLSDPLHGFEEMVDDLEFQFGPLTDIDPLPQKDDKENIPPKSISIARQLQEYHEQKQCNSNSNSPLNFSKQSKNQTTFEKMLTKSFSGAITTTSTSPNDWMSTLFENVEPTPKDATPKDSPKDITTCNTLPCNEESPDTKEVEEKKKATAMPSSPFPDPENFSSEQNEWSISDSTKLNSGFDSPSKKLQPVNDQLDAFDLVQ